MNQHQHYRGPVRALLALFLLSGLQVQAGGYPMKAEQVAPDVYAILTPTREFPNRENRGWNSNSAFVVTGEGVMLFDTGSSTKIGHALRETIAGVTDQPVRWIVNSHGHGDHWLGNAAFDKAEKIYASEEVRRQIATAGQTWVDRFNRMTEGITGHSEIVTPNTVIDKRTEIQPGNRQVVLFPSGNSHSPGDILMWMPREKVLMTGDTVYTDRMPSTFDSDLKAWMKLLAELEKLQPKVVIPGHGKPEGVESITRMARLFDAFWHAVEEGMDAGKADFEMVGDVTKALASFKSAYPGFEEKIKRDISHVYLQVEKAAFQ